MDGWTERRLGDLATFDKGRVVATQSHPGSDAWPYIGADSFAGTFTQFTRDITAVLCDSSDVLMLWDGERSGLCATGLRGAIGSTVARLRTKPGVDGRFLYHQLARHFRWIQARRTGTGVPHVPGDVGNTLWLPLPVDPAEQARIAAVLDAADDAIAKTETVIAKLKQVRAGLLHELLTRGLDEDGHLRDHIAHPERFKDSALGRIPREWEVGRLREKADVFGGKRLPSGHTYAEQPTGYRYLRVLDLFERKVRVDQLVHLRPETFVALAQYEIRDGELFISIAGSLGYCGVLEVLTEDRIILTENAARIHINGRFVPEFLAVLINSEGVQRQISAEKGIGAGVPKLALHRIESLWLARPEEAEQEAIVGLLADLDGGIEAEERELSKLVQLKTGLMADLLIGRVRVPESLFARESSP